MGSCSLSPTKQMTTACQLCDSCDFWFCAAVLRKNGAKGHETYRTWILEDQIRVLVQYWEWLKKCFYAILRRQWYCLKKLRVVNGSKLHDFGTQLGGISLKFNAQQSRVDQFASRGQTTVQIRFWSDSVMQSSLGSVSYQKWFPWIPNWHCKRPIHNVEDVQILAKPRCCSVCTRFWFIFRPYILIFRSWYNLLLIMD